MCRRAPTAETLLLSNGADPYQPVTHNELKHWWRVLPGAAFIYLMGAGSTIVFDETCYWVTFDNYGLFNYYDCTATTEGSHLPAPLGGWVLMAAAMFMLYLVLQPFLHSSFDRPTEHESNMSDNQQPDDIQRTRPSSQSSRNTDNKWKVTAIAAMAALLSVFATLIVVGTNRSAPLTDYTTTQSQIALSGADWTVWEDGGVQYITLDAIQNPADTSVSLFVDVGCYSDYAMMIWVGWTTDVAYWGTEEDVEASLRITAPDGSTIELFGRIVPSIIADTEAHIHYFSVRENDDALELAGLLATWSELRLDVFADLAYWGPNEESSPKDSEFATHVSGVVYPGSFYTYLSHLTRCPYQEYYGVG